VDHITETFASCHTVAEQYIHILQTIYLRSLEQDLGRMSLLVGQKFAAQMQKPGCGIRERVQFVDHHPTAAVYPGNCRFNLISTTFQVGGQSRVAEILD
jgi:hypothetical protein